MQHASLARALLGLLEGGVSGRYAVGRRVSVHCQTMDHRQCATAFSIIMIIAAIGIVAVSTGH